MAKPVFSWFSGDSRLMLVEIGIGGGKARLRLCVSFFPLCLLTLFIVLLRYMTMARQRHLALKHMAQRAFSFSFFQSCGQKDYVSIIFMIETCLTLLLARFVLILLSVEDWENRKRCFLFLVPDKPRIGFQKRHEDGIWVEIDGGKSSTFSGADRFAR